VISGGKRIYHASPSGKEITITDVRDGEVCVFNALCVLANRLYPASAVTLVETKLLVTPAGWCRECAAQSEEMRKFLLGFVGDGVSQLLELIDDLAFKRMDERLSAYLIEKSDQGFVRTTHQMIANDLGTAREVISRILGDFERQGFVALRRNLIEIRDLT
jgi:CRP/FNR family transcriptional regulator